MKINPMNAVAMGFLVVAMLGLGACAGAPGAPGRSSGTTAAGEETVEVGGLAACRTLALVSSPEVKGKTPREYGLGLWSKRASLPSCDVQVDVILYDKEGGRVVFADRNAGSARTTHIPKRVITQGSLLCLEVHGHPIVLAAVTTRKVVAGGKDIYVTCAKNFSEAVLAGRVTSDPKKSFRIVGIVDKQPN